MNNSELISKLNSLKEVNPDQNWLKNNRELLLSQISNSGAESLAWWKILLIDLTSLSKAAAQPVYALGVFILLLLGGSLFSQGLLAKAKPNDSLYIARIIAENVKLNTTFNADDRNKLALQYASVHAQDISDVLANPQFNTVANSAQVAKLNTSFNEEIKTVKNRMNTFISSAASQAVQAAAVKNSSQSEDANLIIADSSKDKQGISMTEKNNSPENISGGEKISTGTVTLKATDTVGTLSASTTLTATTTNLTSSSTLEIANPGSAANKILDDAQKLFDSKDYSQAADKLKEVENIIK